MKRTNGSLSALLFFLVVALCSPACSRGVKDKLIGAWQTSDGPFLEFQAGGVVLHFGGDGLGGLVRSAWSYRDSQLVMGSGLTVEHVSNERLTLLDDKQPAPKTYFRSRSASSPHTLVGSWHDSRGDTVFTFTKDGVVRLRNGLRVAWLLEGDRLTLGDAYKLRKIQGDTLVLAFSSGEPYVVCTRTVPFR